MNEEDKEEEEGKFVIKYVEPYEDVVYFVKTVTVREVRLLLRTMYGRNMHGHVTGRFIPPF